MNNVDTTLSRATECAVMCSQEKVCGGTLQKVYSVYKQISKFKDSHMLPSNEKETVEHG